MIRHSGFAIGSSIGDSEYQGGRVVTGLNSYNLAFRLLSAGHLKPAGGRLT